MSDEDSLKLMPVRAWGSKFVENGFEWRRTGDTGKEWRIGAGASNYLVAEGSAWSMPLGQRLFISLATGAWALPDEMTSDG